METAEPPSPQPVPTPRQPTQQEVVIPAANEEKVEETVVVVVSEPVRVDGE